MTEGKSAWAYMSVGCLTLALIAAVFVVGGSFWLYRSARAAASSMADPAARAARVRQLLGAEELPEGYQEMMAFKIPFLMQVAVLSGGDIGPDGGPGSLGDRGLLYVQLLDSVHDRRAMRDFFEGRSTDPAALSELPIQVEIGEILGHGVLPRDDATLLWLAQRGHAAVEGFQAEGVTALILVECPGDEKTRLAIWFAPDPAPDRPAAETDFAGTPADPEALESFMGHFRLCDHSSE